MQPPAFLFTWNPLLSQHTTPSQSIRPEKSFFHDEILTLPEAWFTLR
jgi:hypothetical protein